jgi:hypothetical protein
VHVSEELLQEPGAKRGRGRPKGSKDKVRRRGHGGKYPPTFIGSLEPFCEIQREAPWHKAAAVMYAMGANGRQLAQAFDKSEVWISNLIRQAWFLERVWAIMSEEGGIPAIEPFRAEQLSSLATLVEIRDNPKAPASARVWCAKDILDRALGKPLQRVETAGAVTSEDPVAEVERLEAEVKRLRSQ